MRKISSFFLVAFLSVVCVARAAKADQVFNFYLDQKKLSIQWPGVSTPYMYQMQGEIFSRKDSNPYTDAYDWQVSGNYGSSMKLTFNFKGGLKDNPGAAGYFIQSLRHIMTYPVRALQQLRIVCKNSQNWVYGGTGADGRTNFSLTIDLRAGSASGCGIDASVGGVVETY